MADTARGSGQDAGAKLSANSEKEWNALRSDFADLRKDVDRLVKALSAEQAERVARLRDRAGEAAESARQAGVAALDTANEQIKASQEALGRQIAGHPLSSVGIAFAAGLLLASLFRGRR